MRKVFQTFFVRFLPFSFCIFVGLGIYLDCLNARWVELIVFAVCSATIFSAIVSFHWFQSYQKIKEILSAIDKNFSSSRSFKLSAKNDFLGLVNVLDDAVAFLLSELVERSRHIDDLKNILSSMVEGVVVVGHDSRIALLTPAVSQMLDLRMKDAEGKLYWEVIRQQEINVSIKEGLTEDKVIQKEIHSYSPRDSFLNMQISPISENYGGLSGIVVVFHDISELKQFAKIRSEFVANVSHELKTPLTSIKGFVETLLEGALSDPSKARHFLEVIHKHTLRLENIVTDILKLSSIESGELALDLELVDISDVLKTIVSFYHDKLEKQNIDFVIKVPSALPSVSVDIKQIEIVFSNLLDNAIKFTPVGGKVSVEIHKEGGYLQVNFHDTGIGIAPEHVGRIFERFYRLDKGRSRDSGGTGLGLAIVKHIVQAHNGKVSLESQQGKGSTFSIFLPVSKNSV